MKKRGRQRRRKKGGLKVLGEWKMKIKSSKTTRSLLEKELDPGMEMKDEEKTNKNKKTEKVVRTLFSSFFVLLFVVYCFFVKKKR